MIEVKIRGRQISRDEHTSIQLTGSVEKARPQSPTQKKRTTNAEIILK